MTGFNSTLVRLEVVKSLRQVHGLQCFNSTLVRLEECRCKQVEYSVLCFNSTLVRLEVSAFEDVKIPAEVSIPLWFDWKKRSFVNLTFLYSFNSTLVRLEAAGFAIMSDTPKVSIPLWFDWKGLCSFPGIVISMFQFHFGSIGRNGQNSKQPCNSCFNSTLVRLEVRFCHNKALAAQCFNSTLVRLEGCQALT